MKRILCYIFFNTFHNNIIGVMSPHHIVLMKEESNTRPTQLFSIIYDLLNLYYMPFQIYFPRLKCCSQFTTWTKTVPPISSPFSS